ncbi:hypothetical protein RBG11_004252 [Vibrio parahaemolyticus]|nr:hypothetical protein [Vibrio parahaemolyticus]
MDESKIIVSAQDAKRHGFCISGCRKALKKYNYDFRDFIKNGISVETLRSFNDPLPAKLADLVIEERSRPDIIVSAREVQELGFCMWGSIKVLANNGIDWRDVVRNGIALSVIKTIEDPRAKRLATAIETKYRGV